MSKFKFAGISVEHMPDGSKKRHFNVTTLKEKTTVWIKLPVGGGVAKVAYEFIPLPHVMTKIAAAHFCREHERFQDKADQDYLAGYIERRGDKAPKPKRTKKTEEVAVATEPVMNTEVEPEVVS